MFHNNLSGIWKINSKLYNPETFKCILTCIFKICTKKIYSILLNLKSGWKILELALKCILRSKNYKNDDEKMGGVNENGTRIDKQINISKSILISYCKMFKMNNIRDPTFLLHTKSCHPFIPHLFLIYNDKKVKWLSAFHNWTHGKQRGLLWGSGLSKLPTQSALSSCFAATFFYGFWSQNSWSLVPASKNGRK